MKEMIKLKLLLMNKFWEKLEIKGLSEKSGRHGLIFINSGNFVEPKDYVYYTYVVEIEEEYQDRKFSKVLFSGISCNNSDGQYNSIINSNLEHFKKRIDHSWVDQKFIHWIKKPIDVERDDKLNKLL